MALAICPAPTKPTVKPNIFYSSNYNLNIYIQVCRLLLRTFLFIKYLTQIFSKLIKKNLLQDCVVQRSIFVSNISNANIVYKFS